MKTVKTAVSLPQETYKRVEALRRKTKQSRSAIYAEALDKLAKAEEDRIADNEYAAAYQRFPETEQERKELNAWAAGQSGPKDRW